METITSVAFDGDKIIVIMSNGDLISSPIKLYPNLSKGTQRQLQNYKIKGNGRWIHWEDLDEDLSTEGFLAIQESK